MSANWTSNCCTVGLGIEITHQHSGKFRRLIQPFHFLQNALHSSYPSLFSHMIQMEIEHPKNQIAFSVTQTHHVADSGGNRSVPETGNQEHRVWG